MKLLFTATSILVLTFLFVTRVQAEPIDSEPDPDPGQQKGAGCEDYQGYGTYPDGNLVGFGDTVPPNYALVQGFQPPNYPWQYTDFCFCVRSNGVDTTFNFDVVVLDDAGEDGEPGNVLRKVTGQVATVPGGNDCTYILVQGINIPVLHAGRQYLGIAWEPVENPSIAWGVDNNSNGIPPPKYRSFDELQSWQETGGFEFALNFRARGEIACEESFTGTLSSSSPTWDRISAIATSLNCNAAAVDVPENQQYYQAIPVHSETGGNLVFEIQSTTGALTDTTLALYCDPFDPDNPTQNLIAFDDDGGPGSLSGFTFGDGLNLAPNTTYWLVVSSFDAQVTGEFTACLTNGYKTGTCATTQAGRLDETSPLFDRPIVINPSTPGDCNASSGFPIEVSTQYAVYQVQASMLTAFEAEVKPVAGGLANSALLLYCDFDPEAPQSNLIAGATVGGEGNHARLGYEDNLYLQPFTTYDLVVCAESPGPNNIGAYTLCLGPNIAATPVVEDCAAGASVSQPPVAPETAWNATANGQGVLGRYYDNFSGLTSPITRVTWWALHSDDGESPCTRSVDQSFARFYSDNAGVPGTQVYEETVETPGVDTGIIYRSVGGNLHLIRYEVTLTTPVELATGWLSLGGLGADACKTYWLAARGGGDGTAASNVLADQFNVVPRDYAFCLYSGPQTHTTDQNEDNIISLSELLRVIQFYNSPGLHCDVAGEDGFAPGAGDQSCAPHNADYAPQNWILSLSELLRVIQFYNTGSYHACPGEDTEDGFCPGMA